MNRLAEELKKLAESEMYPYHMPGHKRRLDVLPANGGTILAAAASLDITEIDDFDNLHDPEGILKEAMERAAGLYGADECYYSVNGSTAGLLTAISAAVPEGKKLIMARNCHRAVYHAVYLRKIEPIYLYPATVPALLTADVVTPEQVENAIRENPDAAAVLIVSPTYDGITADVEAIAEITHRCSIPLIVDAAHGAHFGFHPGFPENPAKLGADLTVVSLHKTMPCMTQTALLLVCGDRVDREKIRFFESVYQTSSPSYFLMAGMDACMALVEEKSASLWDRFFAEREDFLRRTETLEKLRVITAGFGNYQIDPGKILIGTSNTDLTGKALYDILLREYHLQMEMAAQRYVTAIMTCCDTAEGWRRLADALTEIDGRSAYAPAAAGSQAVQSVEHSNSCAICEAQDSLQPYPKLEKACSIAKALDGAKEFVPFQTAEGRICGTFINLYPPGIPLVVPGERISREVVFLIEKYRKQGLTVQGLRGNTIGVLV